MSDNPEALRRLWPIIEKALGGLVFTADKAGEVAADMATVRAALAQQAATPAPAEPCEHCNGTGELFTHADDCSDDLCALNGDEHSCTGQLTACQCSPIALLREFVREVKVHAYAPQFEHMGPLVLEAERLLAAPPATPAPAEPVARLSDDAILRIARGVIEQECDETKPAVEQFAIGIARAVEAALAAPPATPAAQPAEERYTLDEIADACCYADVSDSRYESIAIALREYRRRAALKGNA